MVINTTKTKSMLITTQQRHRHLQDTKLTIKVNNQELKQVTSEKLLGVVLDENLHWREHVNRVYKKITSNLALLRRIKQYLPQWSRILFYNAYIMPHLDFCVTVWGNCSDMTKLLKLQKQAARIILDCNIMTPSNEMFNKLKWLPIQEWVRYRKANMMYKAMNHKTPDYISNMFQPLSSVHKRDTRQSENGNLYLPPRAKLNVFRNSLRYSGADIWNNLPTNIRNAPSVAVFKNRYFEMYFNE